MNKEIFFDELKHISSLANLIHEDSVFFFEETESTNTFLLNYASSKKENSSWSFAVSESQTKGRGRLQRKFYSPSGSGLYFSFCIEPLEGVKNPADYTVASCVAICRAIENFFGSEKNCKIKWVNDIYIESKKVCGILTEGIIDYEKQKVRSAVVGIGINIFNSTDVPEEFKDRIGAIENSSIRQDEEFLREKFLASIFKELLDIFEKRENVIDEYKKRSNLFGKKLTVTSVIEDNSTSYQATAVDITDDAGLVVELADGTKKILHTGEVTLSL